MDTKIKISAQMLRAMSMFESPKLVGGPAVKHAAFLVCERGQLSVFACNGTSGLMHCTQIDEVHTFSCAVSYSLLNRVTAKCSTVDLIMSDSGQVSHVEIAGGSYALDVYLNGQTQATYATFKRVIRPELPARLLYYVYFDPAVLDPLRKSAKCIGSAIKYVAARGAGAPGVVFFENTSQYAGIVMPRVIPGDATRHVSIDMPSFGLSLSINPPEKKSCE